MSGYRATSLSAVCCLLVLAAAASPTQASPVDFLQKLRPDDGAAYDYFGGSVGIDGNVAIGGADSADAPILNTGAAYLFNATTGGPLRKLLPDDGQQEDSFGSAVGVSGNVAVVGAESARNAGGVRTGTAYLFDVATGDQLVKLTPSDGGASDGFGHSVAVSGDRVIVGAYWANAGGLDTGSAYLFDTSGTELAILARTETQLAGDNYGTSVAIDGNLAVIGAPRDNVDGVSDTGSAYLYNLTSGSLVKMTPDDGAAGDRFGLSVGISGNVAIVGARHDSDNGSDSGAAYLFDVTTGDQLAKLLPDDGDSNDYFGQSVAISGNLAVVGASKDEAHGPQSGSAYVFDVTTFAQLAKITPSDAAYYDQFGGSVGVSGDKIVVGSHLDDDNGQGSGSAYVFQTGYLDADFDEDGDVDHVDLVRWQSGFGSGSLHTEGDADGDSDVDGSDYLIWQRQFGSSVPLTAANTAVPESGAAVLWILASIPVCFNRCATARGGDWP